MGHNGTTLGSPMTESAHEEPAAPRRARSPYPRRKVFLARLWAPPDPDLVDAGQRGEWLVAGIRLLVVIGLLYVPLARYAKAPETEGITLVLWLGVAALAEALIVYSAVMRSWGRRWIGFLSGLVDVTLVSLALWVSLRLGNPLGATNDLVIFPVYFLVIGATSLRYDWRVCVITGSAAVLQYLGLVLYAVWQWDLDDPALGGAYAYAFGWPHQAVRLVLLTMATVLATTLVVRAYQQRKLSTRDRLTLLANRGFFDDSLRRIGAVAARSGEPVAVAMIDVDHFKQFNDTYGHAAGDSALREVARVLGGSFRTTDLVARYGGEEFVGLFPGMRLPDAQRRMEEMRATIAALPVPVDVKGQTATVTVSIGGAVWPNDGVSLEEAVTIADRRLYVAKRTGRDRVVTSDE